MLYLPDCPACLLSTTNDDQLEASHGEIIDDGESTCEWENEDCPELCRTEHGAPDHDDDGSWSCPSTGQRYHYCARCGWEIADRWSSYSTEVNGEWLCDPYEHGYTSCEDCSEYVDEDSVEDVSSDDDYESFYVCSSCARSHRREQAERSRPPAPRRCGTCNTEEIHLDLLTERFVCKCHADTMRAGKRPVLMVVAA